MTSAPPLTEAAFQQQVVELARLRDWEDFHVRAGRTLDSWRTPGSGTMAKGWPDLVLIRGSRILFLELKTDSGKVTPDQQRVIALLGRAAEAYILRPRDWSFIERELAR